jgi:hypothetical protein
MMCHSCRCYRGFSRASWWPQCLPINLRPSAAPMDRCSCCGVLARISLPLPARAPALDPSPHPPHPPAPRLQVGSFFEFQIDTHFSCKFGLCGAADPHPPSSSSANSSSSSSSSLPLGVKAYAAVSYLTSYQHMGKANATCRGGCTCKQRL